MAPHRLETRSLRTDPAKTSTPRWSPMTKLLLVVAVLAVPYLLWTRPEPDAGVAAPAARATDAATPTPAAAAGGQEASPAALEPYALPPLERFAAVVERPLFSPTRRMPPLPEPVAEAAPPPEQGPAPDPGPTGPAEPDLRFFGTVRQGDRAAALVTFPATNAVARLVPGDRVSEWEVMEVDRDRLILGFGDERRTFTIFGPSAGGGQQAAPRPAPAAATPSPAQEAPADDGAAGGGTSVDQGSPDETPPPDELAPPYEEPLGEEPTDGGPPEQQTPQ
jgi:general secretion pathway protein N